jgi:hypothetical protein
MQADFLRYVLSFSPVLIRAPILGHYIALDTYQRATIPVGFPHWDGTDRGYGFAPEIGNALSGYIYVTDNGGATELQLTEGTIFVGLNGIFDPGTTDNVLVAKQDAGGTNYRFEINSNTIGLRDGVSAKTLAWSWESCRSLAVRMADGQTRGRCFRYYGQRRYSDNGEPLHSRKSVAKLH